jgi:hypothetical protein
MSVVGPIAAKKLQGPEFSEVYLLQQNSLVICDWCDVAEKVEIEFFVKGHIDRRRRADQEERVSVRRRIHDRLGTDIAAGSRSVSMTNGRPKRSESHRPIWRAMMSVDPPGANGTTMRTGRDG